MKNIRPVLAWILAIAMVSTNINYVKADTVSGDDVAAAQEDLRENEEESEEIAEEASREEEASGETVENASVIAEESSEPGSAGDNIASGTYYGMNWVIDGDGLLTISGNYDEHSETGTIWFSNEINIKKVKIAATGVKITNAWFSGCKNLTDVDVSGFDTSSITDMSGMFYGCSSLTSLDVSGWDTNNVTDMSDMFYSCSNLTSLDVSGWDTDNVINMRYMFCGCSNLMSLDVSGWDTGNVTDMSWMFDNCSNLTSLDVSGWDTGNVINMSDMFCGCSNLMSLDVSGWDTGNVTDMTWMFVDCNSLTNLNLSGWKTGNVTSMNGMFSYCSGLTSLDVSGWDTSSVTTMGRMFGDCSSLTNLDVSGWDTGSVIDMNRMFYGCENLANLDMRGCWDTGSVTDMNNMFFGCQSLTSLDLSRFNTSSVTDMEYMFCDCSGLTSLDLSGFDTSSVTDMSQMFDECWSLTSLNLSGFNTSSVTDMSWMFWNCYSLTSLDVSGWDTGNVTDMTRMFSYCSGLTSLDVSGWDTSSVTTMGGTFGDCSSLTNLDVSDWDTGNVTDMTGMFEYCRSLTGLDVSGWDTNSVTNMHDMFEDCSSLESLDVSDWNIGNVTDMTGMFYACSGLTSLDVSCWDTGSVTNMESMFTGCRSLTSLDLSGFNTSSVTYMDRMFVSCSGLTSLNVSGWNTSNVTDMSYMFYDCRGLTSLDVSGWKTDNVSNMNKMFYGCTGMQKIKTFPHLTQDVSLPVTPMYDMKGNEYIDFFPQNQASIWLYASPGGTPDDPDPVKPGQDPGTPYSRVITVTEQETGRALEGVTAVVGGRTFQTGKDGKIFYNGTGNGSVSGTFTKTGYQNASCDFLPGQKEWTVSLARDEVSVDIQPPSASADIHLENSIDVPQIGEVKWLDMDYTMQLDLPQNLEQKAECDPKKQTLKIYFGIDGDKKTYEDMKNFCNAVKQPENHAVRDFMEKHGLKEKSKFGVDVSATLMGYLEIDLARGRMLEGGAVLGLSGEGSLTWRPFVAAGIVYVKGTLSLSAEGTLTIDFSGEQCSFRAQISLRQALGAAGGLGVDDLHLLEVGAEAGLNETLEIPFRSAQESLEVTLDGKVYVETKFLLLETGAEYPLFDVQLWPRQNQSLSGVSRQALPEASGLKLASRDYDFYASSPSGEGFTLEDAYPDSMPQMCRLADGTLIAAWLMDSGEKSGENRTTLVYAVNDGSGWSASRPVKETGRADLEPCLAVSGDRAALVYSNLGKELESGATAEEMLAAVDVYVTVFENGAFSEPELLSEGGNGVMEYDARIACDGDSMAAAWVENSANSPFATEGTNSVRLKTYENGKWTERRILEDQPRLPGLAVSFADGSPCVAYTMDMDGDPATSGDTELFLWQNGASTRLTSDAKTEGNLQFAGESLFWISNGELMEWKAGAVTSTGIAVAGSYEVLENKSGRAVLFQRKEGFRSELCLAEERDGKFGEPAPVTDLGNHISDFAAAYLDSRDVAALFCEREVLDTEDAVYGATDLHMTGKLCARDLELEEAWREPESLSDGGNAAIHLRVRNGGSDAVSSLKVALSEGGETLYAQTLPCSLAPGARGEFTAEFSLKPEDLGKEVTVTALPGDWTDGRPENNAQTLELGLADVGLEGFAVTRGEDGTYTLAGTVRNAGHQTAPHVRFAVLEGGADGAQICELDCGDLAAGAEFAVSYAVPEGSLAFADAWDVKYFHAVCSMEGDEESYGDNSENLAAFPVKAEGVRLSEESLELAVGGAHTLKAEVFPDNAMEKGVYYASDDQEVAAALEDGTVIAGKEGTAHITATTSDGGYTAVCEVTVTAPAEGAPEYRMSSRWEELEAGKTLQLSVLDAEDREVAGIQWESSDPAVALVGADGLTEGKASGTAYVTAATEDGSYHGVCVIHVTSRELQALVFGESLYELTEGETLRLLPDFYPADTDTDRTLEWTSSNEGAATVDADGTAHAVGAGTATVTAKSVNGVTAQCRVRVEALPRYTVVFDSDIGTDPVRVTDILGGSSISLPADPEREGYVFRGWHTERDGKGSAFTADTKVESDLYLYAHWEPQQSPAGERKGFWAADIAPQAYTGKAIRPAVTVYDGMKLLKEKEDYTVTYKNNVKANDASDAAKAPTAVITGKGNYSGRETVAFAIAAKDLNDADVEAEELFADETGKTQRPVPTVRWNGKKLSNKKDFTMSYPDQDAPGAYQKAGDYRIVVTGKGNYAGEREILFHIGKGILIGGAKVKAVPAQAYNMGEEIRPALTVTLKGKTLEAGRDYTVEYRDNINAGKAEAVITGTGDYAGIKTVTFRITGKSIAKAAVAGLEDKVYNGNEQTQKITVTLDGKTLTEGKDYEAEYAKNTNAGTATLTLRGKGGYTGTLKKKFKIAPCDLSEVKGFPASLTAPYAKGGSTPALELTFNGSPLTVKKDYAVSYKNNKKVTADGAKAVMTVKGKGNFKGSRTLEFTIRANDLGKDATVTMTAPDMPYQAKAGKYRSKPALTDSNGKKLKAGTDYEKDILYTLVSAGTGTAAGTGADADGLHPGMALDQTHTPPIGSVIRVTVIGKGNYTGTIETTYRIGEKPFNKAKASVMPQEYTGSPIALKEGDLTVKIGGTTLAYGKDYEIVEESYRNNVKKGTASVTIRGTGEYAGTKTVKFRIASRSLIWFWRLLE